jgi:hypothetical protein
VTGEYENITLELFYDMLRGHDWHYAMSDDHRAYKRGSDRANTIMRIAKAKGGEFARLHARFTAWVRDGGPVPEPPNEPGSSEAAPPADHRD